MTEKERKAHAKRRRKALAKGASRYAQDNYGIDAEMRRGVWRTSSRVPYKLRGISRFVRIQRGQA